MPANLDTNRPNRITDPAINKTARARAMDEHVMACKQIDAEFDLINGCLADAEPVTVTLLRAAVKMIGRYYPVCRRRDLAVCSILSGVQHLKGIGGDDDGNRQGGG